ncbi:MAG TPA: hypothetical protein VF021_09160 [Longimicrobiales bacterium]
MAEVLVEFDSEFKSSDGRRYEAHACARGRDDGLWEGWLEFVPRDGGAAIRTGRETTQPNRTDVLYWATGLTAGYIDGALDRVLKPAPLPKQRVTQTRPAFDGPADSGSGAVLDPFKVYAQGDDVLRGQLNALDDSRLRAIIRAYRIAEPETANVASGQELVSLIMNAAAQRAA